MTPYTRYHWCVPILLLTFLSCQITPPQPQHTTTDTLKNIVYVTDSIHEEPVTDHVTVDNNEINVMDTSIRTGKTKPDELIRFAQTLIGVPYVWASSDPEVGFDCSGFITYVFNHFNITVPRSSIDFGNVGKTIAVNQAKTGDFILFTGTDPLEKNIGHMGLVVSNNTAEGLQFIHATSGKAMSVTISKLNEQYTKRFVRVSRVFRQNN